MSKNNKKTFGKMKSNVDGGDNAIGMHPCGDPQQKKVFCLACYSHPGVNGDDYKLNSFSKHKMYNGDQEKNIEKLWGSWLCLASIPLEDLMRSPKHNAAWFKKMFGPDYLDKSEEIQEWSKIHDPRFDIWPDLEWTHRDVDWEKKRKEATATKKKKDKMESVRNIFPHFTDDEVEDWIKKNLPDDDASEGDDSTAAKDDASVSASGDVAEAADDDTFVDDASTAAKDDASISDTEDVAKAAADDDTFEGDASPSAKDNDVTEADGGGKMNAGVMVALEGNKPQAAAAGGRTNAGMMNTLEGNVPLQRLHASQEAVATASLSPTSRMHPFILTGYQTAGENMAGGRFPPQAFAPGAFMGRAANMPQLGLQMDNERVATQLITMGRPNPADAIAAAQAHAAQAQAYLAAQAQAMGMGIPPATNTGTDADILAAIQQRQRHLSRLEADFKAKMDSRGGNGGGM